MQKILASLLCTSLLFPFGANAAQEENNTLGQQIQYTDYNYLHNVEALAINPVSISDIPISDITVISAGYNHNKGEYRNVDAANRINGFNMGVYGIARLNKISFEGEVGYFNYKEHDRCWNSTLYQNKLNPFILGDDQPSTYKIDRFVINGRFAYKLSSRVRLGFNADYNVGVMSDESDPRVETKGMRFIINPGIDVDVNDNLTLGATGGLNLLSESSRYTCLQTAVNFVFYLMSGLGTNYPYSSNAYTRDTKGTSWFMSVDGKYNFTKNISNYLTATYRSESENAIDGGSTYKFRGGEYINRVFGLTDRFSITGNRFAHNIEFGLEVNDINGRWFDQMQTSQGGTIVWEVMNASIKHKESLTTARGSYRFDILDNEGVSSLTAGIGLGYTNSDTKNYPDIYFRKYSRLDINANVTKYFNIKKVRMGVGIEGGFDKNLSSSCHLDGLEVEQRYALPMYAFLTSDSFTLNGRIDGKMPVGSVIVGAFVSGGTTKCTAANEIYKNSSMSTINCGVSLSF
ncbi:MAG: hypothetical protein K2F80_04615 [Muribaculaceae bacterium]|nr:hypothetical protein [Muribaculaceae bacterium]